MVIVMRKVLFVIGVLAISRSAFASDMLCHTMTGGDQTGVLILNGFNFKALGDNKYSVTELYWKGEVESEIKRSELGTFDCRFQVESENFQGLFSCTSDLGIIRSSISELFWIDSSTGTPRTTKNFGIRADVEEAKRLGLEFKHLGEGSHYTEWEPAKCSNTTSFEALVEYFKGIR